MQASKTIKRPSKFRILPVAVLLAASLTAVACRQQPATTAAPATAPTAAPPANTAVPGTPAVPSITAQDRDFLTRAASSGMMEVEASRIALDRTQNNEVRDFAQRMLDDHSKANEQLRSIARTAGMADLPAGLIPAHGSHMDRLRALGGQEFEREYAAQVGVAAHTEAVALFERAAQDANNAEVRQFAEQQLPTLRDHLQEAQKLAQTVGVSEERMRSASAKPDLGAPGGSSSVTGMGTPATTPSPETAPATPSK